MKSTKTKTKDFREEISIEFCQDLIYRLKFNQSQTTKLGALIAIKNLVQETKVEDQIIFSTLVDALADPDKKIRELASKIIKEIKNSAIVELLETKKNEVSKDIEKEITTLLKSF